MFGHVVALSSEAPDSAQHAAMGTDVLSTCSHARVQHSAVVDAPTTY